MRTIMRLSECLQLRHVVTRNKGIGAIVGPAQMQIVGRLAGRAHQF